MKLRPSRTVLALALVGALALAASTGAVTWDSDAPLDALNNGGDGLSMQPSSDYAYLDETGETVIDLSGDNPALDASGLNPDAITTFSNVTALHYDGDQYAEVWITHDGDGDGEAIDIQVDGETIESNESAITLEPDQTVGVDLVVDTTDRAAVESVSKIQIHSRVAEPKSGSVTAVGGTVAASQDTPNPTVTVVTPEPGIREVTIENAPRDDSVDVVLDSLRSDDGSMVLDEMDVTAGERGTVEFTVATASIEAATANTSSVAGDANVTPLTAFSVERIGGPALETMTVRGSLAESAIPDGVNASQVRVLRYDGATWQPVDVGLGSVDNGTAPFEVTGTTPGTFVIGAPVPDLRVTSAIVDASNVSENGTITLEALVENAGTGSGSITVPFQVGDRAVAERTVRLGPGESTTLTVEATVNETGSIDVAVGAIDVGPISVAEETTTTVQSTTTTPTSTATTTQSTSTPTPTTIIEERAGISLRRLLGLGLTGSLLGAVVFLTRRVSV